MHLNLKIWRFLLRCVHCPHCIYPPGGLSYRDNPVPLFCCEAFCGWRCFTRLSISVGSSKPQLNFHFQLAIKETWEGKLNFLLNWLEYLCGSLTSFTLSILVFEGLPAVGSLWGRLTGCCWVAVCRPETATEETHRQCLTSSALPGNRTDMVRFASEKSSQVI